MKRDNRDVKTAILLKRKEGGVLLKSLSAKHQDVVWNLR